MMLANLFNVPADEREWSVWSFSNQDHHNLIIQAIPQHGGPNLTPVFLDPIPFFDFERWLERHQQAHNDLTSTLKLTGSDLSILDPNNKEEVEAWIDLHSNEHYLASLILQVS